jgi:DNA modification methylase
MGNFPIRVANLEFKNAYLYEIEVGDRFRKDYGDVAALAQNITKEGLIQPVSVCKNPEGSEKPYTLVAGGRRFRALTFLDEKLKQKDPSSNLEITIRVYPELTEHQLRVLEYSENMYRKDLTWQEKIQLERRIHELQISIHGKKHSTNPDAPGWSQADTADLMGKSKGKISEDLKLAKMMEDLPQVDWGQFKTQADVKKAMKGAHKAAKQLTDAKKAERVLKTGEDRKRVLVDAYKVEDFFVGVKKIGDHTMNFCEIDPPYSIELEKQKKGYNYTGYNEIDPEKYPDFMKNVFRECYRVLKDNSWMIVWFGPDPWFESMYQWITEAGFKCSRLPGLWVKGVDEANDGFVEGAYGQTNNPEYCLANSYEFFFYARKGSPTLNKPGHSNVFGHRPVPHSHKYHPTERPKELITDVLQTFGHTNDRILVPFAGSGRTLLEAAKLSMIPIGFDLTKEYRDGYIIKVHKEI